MKAAPARLKRMAIAIKTPEPSSRWDADVSWNEFWVNPFYGLTEKPLALSGRRKRTKKIASRRTHAMTLQSNQEVCNKT